MSLLVRRAGRRDLEPIQALWSQARSEQAEADARLAPGLNAEKRVAEHREVILADPRTAFFVAEEGGDVVGFLHAQVEPNDPAFEPERFGFIADLFVRPDRRGGGIGTQLLDYCVEWFRSHNLSEYRAATPEATPDAGRFFARRGAEPLHQLQVVSLREDDTGDDG